MVEARLSRAFQVAERILSAAAQLPATSWHKGANHFSEQISLAVLLALHETVGGQLFYSGWSTYLTPLFGLG